MRKLLFVGALSGALMGCSLAQFEAGEAKVFAAGQEFCSAAGADGPMVVALADAAGAPVIVTGLASGLVAAACKAWNVLAIPVPQPPATVTPIPTVTVVMPAT